ncbi:MAG: CapA family protein [Lachnospiraceae bacterium]|nr:MAG: CapA family protein [Lachnospiraceae bacterium]
MIHVHAVPAKSTNSATEERAQSHFLDMSSKKRGLIPLFILSVIITLSACSADKPAIDKMSANRTASEKNTTNKADEDVGQKKDPATEKKKTDAKNKILKKASDGFFAGESEKDRAGFLDWFEKTYGDKTLETIADNGVFDDSTVWQNSTGRTIKTLFWDYHAAAEDPFYKANLRREIKTSKSGEAEFLFSGDLTLAEHTATTVLMDKNPNLLSQCFDQSLMDTMRSADFFTVNNEFCYGTKNIGKPISGKTFTFRADPKRAKLLNRIGVDLVSLANNHVYDYGKDAFLYTLSTLKKDKVPYVGAGKNLTEAKRAYYVTADGRTVAILAGTQIERSANYTKAVAADSPGVLKCLNPTEYVRAIRTAKKYADTVFVICHWGTEGTHQYGDDQTKLAKKFIKEGADAVIGGHTHTLQAVEYVDSAPVFYSLGNFFFSTTMKQPKGYDTGLAKITVKRNGKISAEFIPCRFSGGKTSKLKSGSAKYRRVISDMNSWSQTAVIQKNGMIKRK